VDRKRKGKKVAKIKTIYQVSIRQSSHKLLKQAIAICTWLMICIATYTPGSIEVSKTTTYERWVRVQIQSNHHDLNKPCRIHNGKGKLNIGSGSERVIRQWQQIESWTESTNTTNSRSNCEI